MKGKNSTVTVSGPGVEQVKPGVGSGLSFATTLASHAAKNRIEASFYVREHDGTVVGRADSDGRVAYTYGPDALAVMA